MPDRATLALSSLTAAPRCSEVREDFVRTAIAVFAMARGWGRLARMILGTADQGKRRFDKHAQAYLPTLVQLLYHWEPQHRSDWQCGREPEDHENRMLKEIFASGCLRDPGFVRLAEICGDVLSWETQPWLADRPGEHDARFDQEFEMYVAPMWPVLCDEVEFELDELHGAKQLEELFAS